ncbi:MAG: DUF2029 domain-containing protein [Hyphomicrobiaceae bacterium]|nr:DUF2029 domain-containing protein [Hyphomicrobiaceae bacterium]
MFASGDWVNSERVRFVSSLIIAIGLAALAVAFATRSGNLDALGRPLGTDFASFWTAGALVLDGRAAAPYDWSIHQAFQNAYFLQPLDADFYCWQYPPFFLALAAGLAALPYLGALLVWLGATLAAYLAVMARLLDARRDALVVAIGFPAVWLNIGHGQNAFLTAALFAGGLILLRQRPILAGILIGLLAYKPQFGLLIPLAFIAGGHWRAFAAAGVTVAAMVLATSALFGMDVWSAFLASTGATRRVLLEQGGVGFHKIQSVFAAARALGLGVALAYLAQVLASLAVVITTIRLWRSSVDFDLKAAALLAGTLLATPFSLDYDLVLIAPAAAFLWRQMARTGALPFERSLLAVIFIAPLVARSVGALLPLPLGLFALVALFALVSRRAFAAPRPVAATAPAEAVPA